MKKFIILVFVAFLSSCTSVGTLKQGFQLPNTARIGVLSFVSYGSVVSSGDIVADEFSEQFLMKGYTIIENRRIEDVLKTKDLVTLDATQRRELADKLQVDYVITGTVTKYVSENRYLILQGSHDMIALNNISEHYTGASNSDNLKTDTIVSDAEVGINARLIEVSSGEVVWIGSYSYDAFDIETAVEWTVTALVKSIFKK